MKAAELSRRAFLGGLTAATAAGCASVGGGRKREIRFAAIGAWGMGRGTSLGLIKAKAKLVALCDANKENLAKAAKTWPGLPCYTDYRKMLAEIGDTFEAVHVSTPDHTHAYIAIDCMNAGKHVYVQKPLAHTFEECEMMAAAQRRTGVVVQMGNQGHPGVARYEELLSADLWGEIMEIEAWSDRPGVPEKAWWPQGMKEYMKPAPYDEKMGPEEWNCWVGPAADRGYNPKYFGLPWRGWCDYGCGAIGDMAVHNADPAFWIFKLGLPVSVVGDTCGTGPVTVAYPKQSKIVMKFANGMKLTWYDGGLKPQVTPDMKPGFSFGGNGLLIRGTKATTVGPSHAGAPSVIAAGGHPWNAESEKIASDVNAFVESVDVENHYREFVRACRDEAPEDCGSQLSYAAPLTEALLIGCISLRYPGQELKFDPVAKRFTNNEDANKWLKASARGEWDFNAIRNGRGLFGKLFSRSVFAC